MECLRKTRIVPPILGFVLFGTGWRAMPVAGNWLFVPANTSMKRKPARKATRKKRPDYGRGRQQHKPRAEKGGGDRPPRRPAERERRLQTILAAAGLGSRRQCEELILAGRVEVERQVVTQLGTRVDPLRQKIRVDGIEAQAADRLVRIEQANRRGVHEPGSWGTAAGG